MQNKAFKKIKPRLWGFRKRTSILCRENKDQESEGKKLGVRGTMDTLILFEVIILKCS